MEGPKVTKPSPHYGYIMEETGLKLVVDADACPVKDTIEKVAKEYRRSVILVANLNHLITSDYARVIVVDGTSQAADIAILNLLLAGDILVTQDYGLASVALGKGTLVLDPRGREYTQDNIDELLMRRYLNQKARHAGQRISGPRKRIKEDDIHFEQRLRSMIERNLDAKKK